jgi:hypothetical protein
MFKECKMNNRIINKTIDGIKYEFTVDKVGWLRESDGSLGNHYWYVQDSAESSLPNGVYKASQWSGYSVVKTIG